MAHLLATEQMDDVLAALKYLQTQPHIDAARIAVVGNSFGGILAVFSAERAPGIRAVVASAPAHKRGPTRPNSARGFFLPQRMPGSPIYFFQASNDYDLNPTEKLAQEMALAGKPHTRKIFPAFGTSQADGHSFGYFGGDIWEADVFAFLARMGKCYLCPVLVGRSPERIGVVCAAWKRGRRSSRT